MSTSTTDSIYASTNKWGSEVQHADNSVAKIHAGIGLARVHVDGGIW